MAVCVICKKKIEGEFEELSEGPICCKCIMSISFHDLHEMCGFSIENGEWTQNGESD